jgi:hypothetical protein
MGEGLYTILGFDQAMRPGKILTFTGLIVLLLMSSGVFTSVLGQDPITETDTASGYVGNPDSGASGATVTLDFEYPDLEILAVEVTLTWTDDEGSSSDPDTLSLMAEDGMGASSEDSSSSGGVTVRLDDTEMGSNWTVTVTCLDAGMTPLGPLGRLGTTDPGNSFILEFTYTYVAIEVEPPGPPGPPPNIAALYENPLFWTHVIFMIASTYMFGIVGILAGVVLFFGNRWADDPNRWKRSLSTNRPFRVLAVHTWVVFFIAAIPLGIYVAGKAYGWENSWTSFPVIWNAWFWQWTNADHVSLIVLTLWALPLWVNRQQLRVTRYHAWFFGKIGVIRKMMDNPPSPKLTDREIAIMYFLMGVFVFLVFVVQEHGN